MYKYIFIFISLIFSQGLDYNANHYNRFLDEIFAIDNQEISSSLFIYPIVEKKKNNFYNLVTNKNNQFEVYPVMAIRYSYSGFEMNENIPIKVLWLSPGLDVRFNQLLLNSHNTFNPIWINASFKFYKHSAYGINENLNLGNTFNNNNHPFSLYNPDYSYGFYKPVQSSSQNGVDFDESIGGLSILSNNFDITFGKFRTSLGPSFYSNLSLSNTVPAFNQLRLHFKFLDKMFFTFITGDLFSGIEDDSVDYYGNNRELILTRKIFNHRLDFILSKNFRLGIYEQIISLSTNSSFSYMNPFQLYWSEQHQQGDVDNLQMGFDFEFIKGKNRIYGGLLIDEWAPYDTFSGDENNDGIDDSRNWFASQIGFSRLFNLNAGYKNSDGKKIQRNFKGLLKLEYSSAEPQVYIHKFEINNPYHHGYPIGLWSGGDSIDKRVSFILFINNYKDNTNNLIIDIGYQNTRIGTPKYDQEVSLLSSDDIKIRDLTYIKIQKPIYFNIDFNFKVGYYKTENLYSEDKFLDISTSLIYNIQK